MNFFWRMISYLVLGVLSLRYRIKIIGLENLNPERLNKEGGIIFLPNHPAHMDPLILFCVLWPKYRIRPLVIEYIYRLPLLQIAHKLIRSLPVPNFDLSINQYKIKRAEASMQEIAEGLKNKENFIVYPAGRLKNTGKEVLGGSSAAHALVQECPESNIVLIRTTGLWGSSFSRALLGRAPSLTHTLLRSLTILAKNLIFFAPRRNITIEIEPNPSDFPRSGDRLEINRYLENWYNRYPDEVGNVHEIEPVKLVSYSLWRDEFPKVYKPKKKREVENTTVSEEVRSKVYAEIHKILEKPDLEIRPEMNLALDLGMDSLNIAEMIVFLSRNFDVGDIHPEDMESVQSVLELAEGTRVSEASLQPPPAYTWPTERNRIEPTMPLGRTFSEAFLNICQRMKTFAACGDDTIGVIHYQKMKRSVLVLAQYFRTLPDSHVAVLLPASAGTYITILALQFAGKTPVMLNWTLGPRYLEDMMKLTGAKKVVTSWKFLDRVMGVDFGNLIDQFLLLEDIRQQLSLSMKLRGIFYSHCSVPFVLRAYNQEKINENDPAVILFTSGTEAAPKGVPLSHKNIISNLRSALQCIYVKSDDALYGILPPFHSFGFSVAGFFPLFIGVRVAFYPDPTDSFALAEGFERWKITIFCGAPSFLKGLFHAAKNESLKTARLFVTGAEKAPKELFERAAKVGKGVQLLEGYGITECSPVLTITRPNIPPKGVGQPLPDVELCMIHPETLELLPKGKEGEICARGPNIFNGYIGNPRTPFIEIVGKRWYRTGDIGYLDEKDNLILSGRFKRFTKVGGEMISLGAVEEILFKELVGKGKISSEIPSIAVCADERNPDKSQLVLFTTIPMDTDSANEILNHSGFSRLIKISLVKQIDEIPLMGTGKTDYRKLQSMLE